MSKCQPPSSQPPIFQDQLVQLALNLFEEQMNTTLYNNNMNNLLENDAILETTNSVEDLPVFYTILEVCVAVCAIFGNLLVIVVFLQDRRLRKVTNFYIISLSIADLLVGSIGIPSAILTRMGMPRNSIRLCITMLSLLIVFCTISILNLVAVSLDRYWAILHPLDYHKRISERTALLIICACWVLGSLIGFLPLFGWHNPAIEYCYFIPIMNYDFLVFLYFATIILPSLIMAFFYIRIYFVVVNQLSLNKVRQLNSDDFSLTTNKSLNKQISNSKHISWSTNGNKSSPSAASVHHHFKIFKSISSSQQLDKILARDDQIVDLRTNISPDVCVEQFTDKSCESVNEVVVLRKHHHHRPNSQYLEVNSHNNKERKWKSLVNVQNHEDTYSPKKDPKKPSTARSILNSFYRHRNGNKINYSRREVKKAQKLFVIVVFFMLCWLPLYTSNTIQAFCHNCSPPSSNVLDFLIILSHINSAGSPFLYAFHMKDFRGAIRRLIFKGAINKQKLRDIRREELFSVTSRRGASMVADTSFARTSIDSIPREFELSSKVADNYVYKKHNLSKTFDNSRLTKTRASSVPVSSRQEIIRQYSKYVNSKRYSSAMRY